MAGTTGRRGGARKMREGVNNMRGEVKKSGGRAGYRRGFGATVRGQINRGVKKVGHCTDTGKDWEVKKKGGGQKNKEEG